MINKVTRACRTRLSYGCLTGTVFRFYSETADYRHCDTADISTITHAFVNCTGDRCVHSDHLTTVLQCVAHVSHESPANPTFQVLIQVH